MKTNEKCGAKTRTGKRCSRNAVDYWPTPRCEVLRRSPRGGRKFCIAWKNIPGQGVVPCDQYRVGANFCLFHAPCRAEHLLDGQPLRDYARDFGGEGA